MRRRAVRSVRTRETMASCVSPEQTRGRISGEGTLPATGSRSGGPGENAESDFGSATGIGHSARVLWPTGRVLDARASRDSGHLVPRHAAATSVNLSASPFTEHTGQLAHRGAAAFLA
jgi:hypothetical protein